MTDCPSRECHDKLDGVRRTVYGVDGAGGVVKCLSKFVTKSQAWTGIVCIVLPMLAFGWTLYVKADEKLQVLDKETAVKTTQFEAIQRNITELKASVCESAKQREALKEAIQALSIELTKFGEAYSRSRSSSSRGNNTGRYAPFGFGVDNERAQPPPSQ